VEGVEMKGVGSGWSRQTCQLHTILGHANSRTAMFRHIPSEYLRAIDWLRIDLSANLLYTGSSRTPDCPGKSAVKSLRLHACARVCAHSPI